jgi:ElaB/YqjD/DUF883 family membrane-anchored ribosome-binding protein
MDDQNEGVNERWGRPAHVPERDYAEVDERTAEIRSDIEQTRTDMTETIDAIQEKLRPGNIVSHATETMRNATIEKVKHMGHSAKETLRGEAGGSYRVMDRIRDNPIPAALAAASVAWIAFSGRRSHRGTSPAIYGSTRNDEPLGAEAFTSEYADAKTSRSGYAASGVGKPAATAVRDAGDRIRQVTSTAQSGLRRLVRENPLAAGAIAAAVGTTIGLALPETRRENELMGEARDAAVDRAQEAVRVTGERVQDAARRVQDVAGEAVRKVTGEE